MSVLSRNDRRQSICNVKANGSSFKSFTTKNTRVLNVCTTSEHSFLIANLLHDTLSHDYLHEYLIMHLF